MAVGRGDSADTFGCGRLVSPRLETMALSLASRLGGEALPKRTPAGRQRWLHVLSIAKNIGGHTTMVRRWIEIDDSGDEHHLAVTSMERLDIPELSAAIERTGGTVTLLGGASSLLDRSRRLHELAARTADRIVIHAHPWDLVPTIAFGRPGGAPVLFVNHADHTFWIGAAIADLVVNLRQSGQDLTLRHRGVERNVLLRIPLPAPAQPSPDARAAIRTRLGIPSSATVFLTVGAAYKYTAVGAFDFPAMVQALLTELPQAYLIAVGPSASDRGWATAANALGGRLICLGWRPAAAYRAAADVYLEGFPFNSHTALLEAAVAGLPAVRIPASAIPPFSGNHYPLSAVSPPADVPDYRRQAVALARSSDLRRSTAKALHDAVVALQCGDNWRPRLAEMKAAVPATHAVHAVSAPSTDAELDRLWTIFLMRVHRVDPLRFVRLAAELRLDSRPGRDAIQAEHRRQLGPQKAIVRARAFVADRLVRFGLGRLLRTLYLRARAAGRSVPGQR